MSRTGKLRVYRFGPIVWTAALAIAVLPAAALAQATVRVELRCTGGACEAEVMLSDAEGVVHRCQTEGGRCAMARVAAGRYTISARDSQGRMTTGRPVMIPDGGEVTLIVAAPAE